MNKTFALLLALVIFFFIFSFKSLFGVKEYQVVRVEKNDPLIVSAREREMAILLSLKTLEISDSILRKCVYDNAFLQGKLKDGISSVYEMKSLSCPRKLISDLQGIESLVNLVDVDLSFNNIENITPLNSLIDLQSLKIRKNKIIYVLPLRKLLKLKYLDLRDNPLSDIETIQSARFYQRAEVIFN